MAAITTSYLHTPKQRKKEGQSPGMVVSSQPKLRSTEIPLTSKAGYGQQGSDCRNHLLRVSQAQGMQRLEGTVIGCMENGTAL